jgi:hypothetical protein
MTIVKMIKTVSRARTGPARSGLRTCMIKLLASSVAHEKRKA